jgi:hypothetical protein
MSQRARGHSCQRFFGGAYCKAHICACIAIRNGKNIKLIDFLLIIFYGSGSVENHHLKQLAGYLLCHARPPFRGAILVVLTK